MKKKKDPVTLFVAVFIGLVALVVVQNLMWEKMISLLVADNAGVSLLETVNNTLVCVFQDGRTAM